MYYVWPFYDKTALYWIDELAYYFFQMSNVICKNVFGQKTVRGVGQKEGTRKIERDPRAAMCCSSICEQFSETGRCTAPLDSLHFDLSGRVMPYSDIELGQNWFR